MDTLVSPLHTSRCVRFDGFMEVSKALNQAHNEDCMHAHLKPCKHIVALVLTVLVPVPVPIAYALVLRPVSHV